MFIVVPLVEALLLAKIGAALGWANTIVLVILTGIVGAWLFKLEGGRAWRKWQESLAQGRTPEEGVLGGLLLLLAGALLVTPGVITDGVGLALLFGPTRRMLSAWLMPQITDRFSRRCDRITARPRSAVDRGRMEEARWKEPPIDRGREGGVHVAGSVGGRRWKDFGPELTRRG